MTIFKSIVLGCVQGITEFLPVSSSGHLVVLQEYFSLHSLPLLFDVLLHGATLVAVCVYFRKQIGQVISAGVHPSQWKQSPDARILLFVIAGTIPTGLIAVCGKEFFKQAFQNVTLTGFMFFVTGGLLVSTVFEKKTERKSIGEIPLFSAVFIGIVQGCAIMPGLSRSGLTISLAILLGWKKELAFRFSFLLMIPAVAGALVLEGVDYSSRMSGIAVPFTWWFGVAAAFLFGLGALTLLWKSVQRNIFRYFGLYCFLIGLIVLLNALR